MIESPGPGARWQSLLELLAGAAIVIAHNVYHVLPNEVPILFLLGWISVRVRNGQWSAIGFKRPASWLRLIALALAAAALRIVLGDLVIEPIGAHFWPEIVPPEGAEKITGNIGVALLSLVVVWTFAAVGEEIAYRGYLTLRAAEAAGRSGVAWWLATSLVSILFGLAHYYKGITGIIDSSVAGFILGAAYLLSGRNLWAAILAHGFIDSFAVVALFYGLDI